MARLIGFVAALCLLSSPASAQEPQEDMPVTGGTTGSNLTSWPRGIA